MDIMGIAIRIVDVICERVKLQFFLGLCLAIGSFSPVFFWGTFYGSMVVALLVALLFISYCFDKEATKKTIKRIIRVLCNGSPGSLFVGVLLGSILSLFGIFGEDIFNRFF